MSVELDSSGEVIYVDLGETHRWASLNAVAEEYWRYQSLTGREREADPMFAYDCVDEFVGLISPPTHERVVDLLQELVDTAHTPDSLGMIGAHPLDDLMHTSAAEQHLPEVERRAGAQPRFRAALMGVWLDDEMSAEVRRRLIVLGVS